MIGMFFLFFCTFLNMGCDKMPEATPAWYLDPHLHSARSSDWNGEPGAGELQAIREYARSHDIAQVWLTDHLEDNPEPFPSDEEMIDGVEICTEQVYCLNYGYHDYKMLTHPYEISDLDTLATVQGIEVLTTGGHGTDLHTGVKEAVALIQRGYKLHFFGSSNNHASLVGFGGLTAFKIGTTFADHIQAAVRGREYTMFLELEGNRLIFTPPAATFGYATRVDVYPEHLILSSPVERDEFDPNSIATFIIYENLGEVYSATSPIYSKKYL